MGSLAALAFSTPAVLAALAALPVLWWLLRVTPPRPRRLPFPPLSIVLDLIPERQTPARTPPWLLMLRLAIAALAILAVAGPVWQPDATPEDSGKGPLLILIDNDAAAAHDWQSRIDLAAARVEAAARQGRSVAIVAMADKVEAAALVPPAEAQERLRAIKPQPHMGTSDARLPAILAFLREQPQAGIVWIAAGAALKDTPSAPQALRSALQGRSLTVYRAAGPAIVAVADAANRGDGLVATLRRVPGAGPQRVAVIASDIKGLALGRAEASFTDRAEEAQARFDLPLELRNAVTRIEVEGERSAAAVHLVDESLRRRRVGLVSGASAEIAQPLLSPTYYVAQALGPFAEIRETRGAVGDAVARLLDENASVIVLADVGAIDRDTTDRLTQFVDRGGVLIRFAGSRLAAAGDSLLPVKLRRGGRSLGGSLSWDAPKALAPFPPASPFAALSASGEVSVRRQILAEPEASLTPRTWASLADGTPIVTGEKRGEGHVVLFHVTADPAWSNLPLSGLFVDMLRDIVGLSGRAVDVADGKGPQGGPALAPRIALDGFGAPVSPPATARPRAANDRARATLDNPPGFYGPVDGAIAVNALLPSDRLDVADFSVLDARMAPIEAREAVDLRGPLLAGALALFALDTLALLLMGGAAGALRRRGAAAALVLAAIVLPALIAAHPALAQEKPPIRKSEVDAAFATRLAYVITGDAQADEASRAGLAGLTQQLMERTAMEPGDPIGIDPAKDELAVYPLIYWPVVPGRPVPTEQALRRIDGFMRSGGTIVFDTRDAPATRPGGEPTPATLQLRRILSTLDVPELETLPRDHVLTKAFYLIDELPGRYAAGRTWLEALPPPAADGEARPARSGDGISPILITSNDLAAAWAVGPQGSPLYPVSGPERQREMAIRGGINLVMYALTGNYKTDQVHVGPLLDRLGQ